MSVLKPLGSVGLLLAFAISAAQGHPPDEAGNHEHPHHAQLESRSLNLPVIEGDAKPWSDKPVLNGPGRFQFAVVTDNTGGHRPGIWMKGMRSLNLLRPEFVVSVGDLIEGYSEDEKLIEEQWKEFLGFIDHLQMRFFFVAGNHDVSNPTMHGIWRKHFGVEWYSFDYKGVHFVCLLSENPSQTLGKEQLAWLEKDLEKNSDARWTFLFMHKPLWVYAERELAAGNADPTNWKKVEALLGSRPHTVFAGHVHHYVQYHRNGMQYFHLATTGGGSQLRGKDYGEFDHITWVTVEEDGPQIAHVLLDGVLAPDAVTEPGIAKFRQFLQGVQVSVDPVLIKTGDSIQAGEIHIHLTNSHVDAVTLDASLLGLPLRGLTVEPAQLSASAAPQQTQELVCRFAFTQPMAVEQLREVTLLAKVRSQGSQGYLSELTLPVTIDRQYPCSARDITVDGSLEEWPADRHSFSEKPSLMGATGQWQGPADCSLQFQTACDNNFLYFAGDVSDDQIVAGKDRVYFGLDARPFAERVRSEQFDKHCYTIELDPAADRKSGKVRVLARRGDRPEPAECQVAVMPTANGFQFELAVPISLLNDAQEKEWADFQMTTVLRDVDEPREKECFVLWRPSADVRRRNTNYAHFTRN